jgi:hypothetical protein
MNRIKALCLVVATGPMMAFADENGITETVFRSVDQQGNVTYSEQPLDDASRVQAVEIAPPPTAEAVEAAFRQQELDRKLLELMVQSRLERERLRNERQREIRQRRIDEAQLRHLRQMEQSRYEYGGGYVWPYYRLHGRPPHYWRPPHHGHWPRPLPEYPPRRTAVANVPGRTGK